jgi:hypothetical protein
MVGFGGELSIYSRYVFLFHIISASYFNRVEEPLSPKKKMEKKKRVMQKKNMKGLSCLFFFFCNGCFHHLKDFSDCVCAR